MNNTNKPNSNLFMTGISLTEKERAIVDRASKDKGLNNFSATLRVIINEWSEMRKEYITVPIKGTVK